MSLNTLFLSLLSGCYRIFFGLFCFFLELKFISLRKPNSRVAINFISYCIYIFPQFFIALGLYIILQKFSGEGFGLFASYPMPYCLMAFLSILLLDFGSFSSHLLEHKIPVVWLFHRVHHTDLYVDVSTRFRKHPLIPIFTSIWITIYSWMLGVPHNYLILYLILSEIQEVLAHGNFKLPDRLESLLQKISIFIPRDHKIHHSLDKNHESKNFGNIFSIWDKFFKSYQSGKNANISKYGIMEFQDESWHTWKGLLKTPFAFLGNTNKQDSSTYEIINSKTLRFYGASLSFCYLITVCYWFWQQFPKLLSPGMEGICWPFFPNCSQFHILSEISWSIILVLVGISGIVGAVCFIYKRLVPFGMAILFGLILFKIGFVLFDFRARSNMEYMSILAGVAFLFVPNKKSTLQWLLILIYFFAGILKTNKEWISGANLYGELWFIKGALIPYACFYVLLLETAIILGVFAKQSWVRWAVLFQLFIFHLMSFPIVGFYYPLLMLLLLLIFPLSWYDNKTEPKLPLTWESYTFLGIFSLLQFYPYFLSSKAAVSGEGRSFALHMFDSKNECNAFANLKFKDGRSLSIPLTRKIQTRLRCDPIVFLSLGRNLCSYAKNDPNFLDFDIFAEVKTSSHSTFEPLMDIKKFCETKPMYSFLKHNSWIIASN